ncbi:hypothetical protein L6452_13749 [Arctium lappa]|uniref:Uncharacterized protein n=1 Tax=Arctium lappa TaxID=4217 RepID=A0ACB9CJ62_ARCLA|nr:hypothetical protein L6452_13749 [Arctium lappa]
MLKITTLKRFAANQNHFTSAIPLGTTRYLRNLDLSYNRLNGSIPSNLLFQPNLQTVDLSANNLEDSIPSNVSRTLFRLRAIDRVVDGVSQREGKRSMEFSSVGGSDRNEKMVLNGKEEGRNNQGVSSSAATEEEEKEEAADSGSSDVFLAPALTSTSSGSRVGFGLSMEARALSSHDLKGNLS